MYRPNKCRICFHQGGFDEDRNPIAGVVVESRLYECYFDDSKPVVPVYTDDGQLIPNTSGIIYFNRDFLYLQNTTLEVGMEIKVYDKAKADLPNAKPYFVGKIKAFSADMFHFRVWV